MYSITYLLIALQRYGRVVNVRGIFDGGFKPAGVWLPWIYYFFITNSILRFALILDILITLHFVASAALASSCILGNYVPMYLSIYLCLSTRSIRAAELSAAAD